MNKFDFDFNGIENGIPLQKKNIKFDIDGHASHPRYDDSIANTIEKIASSDLDDLSKFEKVKVLIESAKSKLEVEVLLGSKNVNDIISF